MAFHHDSNLGASSRGRVQFYEGDNEVFEYSNSGSLHRSEGFVPAPADGINADLSQDPTLLSAPPGNADDLEEDRPPYYHPALPTPAEDPAPPPPPMEQEEPTPFQLFMASPIDFIFGGDDDDDDVSTLDGGFLDGKHWGNEDDSAMRQDPAEKSLFKGKDYTIYEGDEEEADDSEAPTMPTYAADETPYTEKQDIDDGEYTDQGDTYTEDRGGDDNSLYRTNDFMENEALVKRSYHSTRSSVHPSVTDEHAARARHMDDDVSISLSVAFGKHIERLVVNPSIRQEPVSLIDSAPMPPSRSYTVNQGDTDHKSLRSAKSGGSGMYQSGLHKGDADDKSWRSVRSSRSGMSQRSPSSSTRAQSVRTANSLMPEPPEIISSSTSGTPMMTRGMSGRAVVHISMDHAADGSIKRLDYTIPVVDVHVDKDDEYFLDEETVLSRNKFMNPWNDDYFAHSKVSRNCRSRKCIRLSAVLLLAVSFVLTATISLSTVSSLESALSTAASSSSEATLEDVSAPTPIKGVKLPTDVDTHIKNWLNAPLGEKEIPFFFHIPLSGALIASECWTHCLGFIVASDGGKKEVSNNTLEEVQDAGGSRFVNVDLSNAPGIAHAAKMNLVPSNIPDVVISPLFPAVVGVLFNQDYPTTLITTMRHPISRAVAMFGYLKRTKADPMLAAMSLEEYALSGYIENNYVVRLLSGKNTGALSVDDLNYCKELLRKKAIVGLYEDMEVTINHIQRYFGWSAEAGDAVACERKFIQEGLSRESAEILDLGSSAYSLILQQNLQDIALYDYIRNKLVPFQMEVIARKSKDTAVF